MDVTYEELRRLQNKEKAGSALEELSDDFYAKAWTLVSGMRSGLEGEFSLVKAREYENALKILRDIYLKRESKILLRAIRVARTGEEVHGLTSEENRLLQSIVGLLKESQDGFEGLARNGREAGTKNEIELVLMADLPGFAGLDGGEFGPYGKGERVKLPAAEAERLLRRKAAMRA